VFDDPDFNLSEPFFENAFIVTEVLGCLWRFARIDEYSNELVFVGLAGMNPEAQNGRGFVRYRFESVEKLETSFSELLVFYRRTVVIPQR
jgi:hypothetical protein